MLKPARIREIIVKANPYLARDPDKLQVFLDSGEIACHGAASLSFEYRYKLNIIVQDFPDHADRVILPVLAYLRTNQPELFENHDNAKQVIRFDAELLSQDLIDLSIEVNLTERVIVETVDGRMQARHVPEPAHPQFPAEDQQLDIYDRVNGTLLGTIDMPAWRPDFG
ncbi:phage tail protein [Alcaligenaceae bacterium SJ-26]|nr:phage tail protein [Alcaligenaceae bacterium SJ-26]